MNCNEAQELKHAYLDGELDLVRNVAFADHLKSCAACSRAHQDAQNLRSALRSEKLYFHPPPGLQKNILATLRAETADAPRPALLFPWHWFKLAGITAMVALLAWVVASGLKPSARPDQLTQEITSSHIRSLMANHLTDVASTDQHTVKPWFDGRVDFAPPVMDLADHGFPLIGGRLDYLQNRSVAALVYQRQKHFINLFIWPADAPANTGEQTTTRNGYNLIHWYQSGMTYWAVSDLNRSELQDFTQLIRGQTVPAPKP
ncbi:MAG: putative transrane anti-sigma factor [Pedosphaera sp.]|nr:putative transrane anti-sigma factor [Pedosphaera sp.]